MGKKFQVKLKVILATKAAVGIIFRRGPSGYVQLIKWDTAKDTFEYGDWLRGRVYEDESDLSPDGQKLIYVAADYHQPLYRWTAMSRPPFLTPFVLWPSNNDNTGGGFFDDNNSVIVRLQDKEIADQTSFVFHKRISVQSWEQYCEAQSLERCYEFPERLAKKGWSRTVLSSNRWIYSKRSPAKKRSLVLLRSNEIHDLESGHKILLGDLSSADWDTKGDFLFSKEGKLFRWPSEKIACQFENIRGAVEVADFTYPVPKFI